MKKKIILTTAVLAVLFLTIALSSCALLGNNPTAMWARINRAMNKQSSFEMDTEMDMVFYVDGNQVTSRADGRTIEVDIGKDSQYFYQRTNTTVKSTKLGINQNIVNLQAYHEGNYFLSNRGTDINQRLYSPMSLKDAMDYRLETDLDVSTLFLQCDSAEVTDNGDGTKTLRYSDYRQAALDELAESMGLHEIEWEYEIVDMPVAITVDGDHLIQKIEIAFTFDTGEDSLRVPSISMVMTYSEYGTAEREVSALKTDSYVQVEDIRLLSQLEDMLKEREEQQNDSFTLTTSQTTKIMGQSSTTKETDVVTYGTGEDGYFYEIDATINGEKYDISYKNGKQKVTGSGTNKTEAQTEKEAKDFISGLINSANFSADHVTAITEIEDGVYKLESDKPEPSAYKSFFAGIGGTYAKATQTITITVENGNITKIECEVKADGNITSGYNTYGVGLTIKSTVTFD